MNIALLAHEKKKELMVQFCMAYSAVLARHNLLSSSTLSKTITENTGLNVIEVLSFSGNAEEQIASRVSCEEIDVLLFFRDPQQIELPEKSDKTGLLRLCDVHNIPVATNTATAEVIVLALERGDLDWIEYNKSDKNK